MKCPGFRKANTICPHLWILASGFLFLYIYIGAEEHRHQKTRKKPMREATISYSGKVLFNEVSVIYAIFKISKLQLIVLASDHVERISDSGLSSIGYCCPNLLPAIFSFLIVIGKNK